MDHASLAYTIPSRAPAREYFLYVLITSRVQLINNSKTLLIIFRNNKLDLINIYKT